MKRWKFCLLFMAVAVILLCGCEREKAEAEVEVTEATAQAAPVCQYTHVAVWDFEPLSNSLFMSSGAEQTVADGNTYEFEASIPENERDTFVENQRKLFALIGEKTDLTLTGYTFRILGEYDCRTLSEEKKAYYDIDVSGTWEQALTTMQLLMGDYTNYGYLYALSDILSVDLGWRRGRAEFSPEVFEIEPAMLSLVYPCFDEVYSERKEIRAARAMSVMLLGSMEEPFAGEESFLQAAEKFARTQNLDYRPTYLRFARNGSCCPMKVEGKYLEFFRDDQFEMDLDVEDGLLKSDWTQTVSTMIEAFEAVEAEIGAVREAFEFQPEERLPTILTGDLSTKGNGEIINCQGLYYSYYEEIYTRSLSVILHEYVHYVYDCLASDNHYESWKTEALAYYYDREHVYQQWINRNGDDAYEYFKMIVGKKLTDADVFMELMDAYIYMDREKYPPKYWIGLEACGGEVLSIASYIVRNYGEESFVKMMINPLKAPLLTGKTLDEIVDDWSNYILHEKDYTALVEGYEKGRP